VGRTHGVTSELEAIVGERSFRRADRVGAAVQRVLGECLLTQIHDPRLEHVVITAVQMSADLRSARVLYHTLTEVDDRDAVAAGLRSASGTMRRAISGALRLRYVPRLSFHYDEALDRARRIEDLIAAVRRDPDDVP